MNAAAPEPEHQTPDGGFLVGSSGARARLVLFEDPQCPYCRDFEERSGDMIRREVAAGAVAVEYRMRSFLGPESERAVAALAAGADAGVFDELRHALFAAQPTERSGGFSADDLVALGRSVGINGGEYEAAVRAERFVPWARAIERRFRDQDPDGTPAGILDGRTITSPVLLDPDALGRLIRS